MTATDDLRMIYAEFGAPAVLSIAGNDYQVAAIDRSTGAAVGADLAVQTTEPAASILAADLAALGLVRADLDDAMLTLNGADWRISSVRPLPSPAGEADGEYLLLLEAV
jgi:hypothetical protein